MSLLRRFAPLIISVVLVGALGAVGLQASAGANSKAEALHRRDRETLQETLAGLTHQYLLFAFKEEFDFASTGPWSLRPGDSADQARLRGFVSQSPLLNYGAALVALDKTPINVFATDSAGVPAASDAGYTPLVQALLAQQPGVSSVLHAGTIPVVGLAVPVTVNGAPQAVLVAYFRADKSPLQTYTVGLHYGKTGKGGVLDSTGTFVAAGDPKLVGQRLTDGSVARGIDTQRPGLLETDGPRGKQTVSYAPVDLGGWSSMTEQSAAEFYGP